MRKGLPPEPETGPLFRSSLGWKWLAEWVARRAERSIPAYRKLMAGEGKPQSFADRPVTSKDSYLRAYSLPELLGDNADRAFAVFRSSGASGQAHYWPQLRSHNRFALWATRRFLEDNFEIHKRKTLAIVGASLGSWVGGDGLSWILKSIAVRTRYPFTVFAPGKRPAEIIEAIAEHAGQVDRVLLVACPSDFAHLATLAEAMNRPLPLAKLRFCAIGEGIPERVRMDLQARSGLAQQDPFLVSVYASADTGTLGFESRGSIAARKLLTLNEALAEAVGLGQPVPHLFHYCAANAYVELVGDKFCVTRWQGVPIVRYHLEDQVQMLRWRALRRSILESKLIRGAEEPLREAVRQSSAYLADVLAVHGRIYGLTLGGSNFSEAMLDAAIRAPELRHLLTGHYRAQVAFRETRQFLELRLELQPGVAMNDTAEQQVYDSVVQAMGRMQPEFHADWQSVYRLFDRDASRRILQFQWQAWPALSHVDPSVAKQASLAGRVTPPAR